MKKLYLLFVLVSGFTYGQIVTAEPFFFGENDSITVYFDASKGNKGLMGYTGDVYAHTGVLTNLSVRPSDWKYVKTSWGQNTTDTKLERVAADYYKLVIKPSVRGYYGVPASEVIQQLAFVFRSGVQVGGKYLEGKTEDLGDIFIPLFGSGLNVAITNPVQRPLIVQFNDTINITAISSSYSSSLMLYVDNFLVATTTTRNTIEYSFTASSYSKSWVKAVAADQSGNVKADSFYFVARPPVSVQERPAGVIDGINYISNSQVILLLFAPYKEYVYVLGDFNNWEVDPDYYMKKTPDGARFWLEVDNLIPQEEYIYQYFVDGKLRIADWYAEKQLDPVNDKYISSSTYPNLIKYPEGKTTQYASVLQTAQTSYQWNIANFNRPAKESLVIYELLIRDFTTLHDFKTLKDTLRYLKSLGVNAIELMPVSEFEGNESWGYNPAFYFAPDKYYGTKDDLKKLIDEAHKLGMAVIMDIVLNHSYGQSSMVRLYAESPGQSPWFNVTSPNPVYSWGYDFNHQSQATQDFVDRVNNFWLSEYKFDGFRFDFTKGFTNTPGEGTARDPARIAILKRMADKIWQYDSSAYIILEHFAENSEEKELADYGMMLWGNINYNYNEAAMGYNDGGKSDFSGGYYKTRGWQKPHLVSYMESHDEERLMYKNLQYGNSSGSYNIKNLTTAIDRVKMAAAFFFTLPGPKMIWQFGELGYDVSIDYLCRVCNKPIKWEYFSDANRKKLYKTFSELIKLRNNYEVFTKGDASLAVSTAVKRINISHPSMNVTIVGNFDVVQRTIVPGFQHAGTWYNFFFADSISVTDVNGQLTLNPGEFHIFTDAKLPAPEPGLVTHADESVSNIPAQFQLFQNYPNPFNPVTRIRYSIPVVEAGFIPSVQLKVYDILGREAATLVNEVKQAGIYEVEFDAKGLSAGIYFYRFSAGNYLETRKLVLLK